MSHLLFHIPSVSESFDVQGSAQTWFGLKFLLLSPLFCISPA